MRAFGNGIAVLLVSYLALLSSTAPSPHGRTLMIDAISMSGDKPRGILTLKGIVERPPPKPKPPKPKELIDQLIEAFPATFRRRGPRLPLAVGIRQQLQATMPEIPSNAICRSLSSYCSAPAYLRAIIAGATRVGLDGKPAGTVTAEQARHAAERLARIEAQRQAKPIKPKTTQK
jgi:ProP effector